MAEGHTMSANQAVITETETVETSRSPTLVLKLKKPKNDKKVSWETKTVDNEHMNKKKSKCCCIYQKQRLFGESSSDESDDDGCSSHCRGHKDKCYQKLPPESGASADAGGSSGYDQGSGPSAASS